MSRSLCCEARIAELEGAASVVDLEARIAELETGASAVDRGVGASSAFVPDLR